MEFTAENKYQRDLIIKMARNKNLALEKSTVNNLKELITYLLELDNTNVMQVEIAEMLGLCQSSISDLLKKAQEIGLIAIRKISQFSYKTARNEYTLLDTDITNVIRKSIKKLSNKQIETDSRELIKEAIIAERKNYEGIIDSKALDLADSNTLKHCKLAKAVPPNNKGEGYYAQAVRDAVIYYKNIEAINNIEVKHQTKHYPNKTIDSFNNYGQRTYDYTELEKKLLGWDIKKE